MCQTTAYLVEEGKEIPLLQDVVSVTPEQGRVRMVNLFGEERIVQGKIKQIDLLSHRIVICQSTP